MRRIIIHAGFHKTGTTHLQQTLRANRAALRPEIRLVLKPGMKALCESARAFSRTREDYDLGMVKYEAAMLIERLDTEKAGTIILTSEDLSGDMPGRNGLHGYGAAPHIMRALSVAFGAAAPDDTLTFFFTTRMSEPWLRSCYAQHLRAARMVWDEADYLKRLKSSADHGAVLELIKHEIPKHDLIVANLEDHANKRLGTADALLEILGIPAHLRDRLKTSDTRNVALPDAINAELLALNRSNLDDSALRNAKRAIIEGAS